MKHYAQVGALVLALGLLGPDPVQAQMTLSFRGGASVATFGGDDVDELASSIDSRTGLNIGGSLTFGLGGSLGIQVGGAFVQKGFTLSEEGVSGTFSLDYIEIPILLSLQIPTTGSILPRFLLGPAISFEVGCSLEASGEGVTVSADCSEEDVPTKSIDIGAMAGVGVDIATSGPLSITLDVLYNLGLSSVPDETPAVDVKNRAWSFLVGVAVPIG